MPEQILLILALVFGFYMAWNIGANDVANAFGTSIGSGAITYKQALVLAAIFEFSAAFLVGGQVTDTIKGNIVHPSVFQEGPHFFAIGMLAALLAASIWLNIATYLGQPVSTTHAIIGAVIGFGIVSSHGLDAIQWHKMGRISASWFLSPLLGGVLASALYFAVRKLVLRHATPARRAAQSLPFAWGGVVFVMSFSILDGLLPRTMGPDASHLRIWNIAISLVAATLMGLFSKRRARKYVPGMNADLDSQYKQVEARFGRLQVLTACFMAFAHGSNDVANAIGPIAAVLQAIRGTLETTTVVPAWVLAFGGFGIVVGLATYGYKVMAAIGSKITEVTPIRGFCAEFATATTVLASSLLGLPISTTFVLVGAVMGIGMARGFGAIDLGVVKRIFLSWIITIPCSAALGALLYGILRHILT
ncbi:MAG: inorganic phosphate transporter [Kiritimatiellae bacterium]|nr:inorganic phosphate transporter [Kiritimatiellia bacterium]